MTRVLSFTDKLSVTNSMNRILLTGILTILELLNVDIPYNYTCLFYVNVKSYVITPNFHAFDIPLIFELFQPSRLQIFCILMTKIVINLFLVQLALGKLIIRNSTETVNTRRKYKKHTE